MGKKAKAAKADHRKRQKQMRKSAERARYQSYVANGTNSKRNKIKQKKASKFRPARHIAAFCGNTGCSRCFPDLALQKFNDSNDPRVRFVVAKDQKRD